MEDILLHRFLALITVRTGLHIRDKDHQDFRHVLVSRVKELKLSESGEYYQLLDSSSASGELEWKRLIARLTNGESYFFRDKGQFALLRHKILPELIERHRQQRTLRIWSAGCSTGEEPYSLAMVVHELLPQRQGWNISIIGTDINEEVLAKARQGIYNEWSFRLVDVPIRERYFRRGPDGLELDREIRSMVTFRQGNLRRDAYPDKTTGIYDVDLILCRNVLIYFDRAAVAHALEKFTASLANNGYLITGHAELNHQDIKRLHIKMFPESVVYQRLDGLSPHHKVEPGAPVPHPVRNPSAASPPASSLKDTPVVRNQLDRNVKQPPVKNKSHPEASRQPAPLPVPKVDALTEIAILMGHGNYRLALEKLDPYIKKQGPANAQALYFAAECYANLGDLEAAVRYCRQAIAANTFEPEAYHLLAHITEEQGQIAEAKELFKKAIYLAPAFVPSYLELAAIYEQENDINRARQMRLAALDILKTLQPDTLIQGYGDMTVAALSQHLQRQLE